MITRDKSLPETLLTQFTDGYVHHQAWLSQQWNKCYTYALTYIVPFNETVNP